MGEGNVLGERGCDEDRGEAADASDEGGFAGVEVLVADVFMLGVCAAVDDDAEDDEDLAFDLVCCGKFGRSRGKHTMIVTTLRRLSQYST